MRRLTIRLIVGAPTVVIGGETDLVALIKHLRIWVSSDSLKTLEDRPFGVVEGLGVDMVRWRLGSFGAVVGT